MSKKNAFYAQSGGVTAVINASACGVIETARRHKARIGTVYAGRNGILGALDEDMIDTGKESAAAIAALRHTPGGAFGSARYKLKGLEQNRAEYERLIAGLPRARHRLFLLQRRRRLGGHLPQGLPARRDAGLPDHRHPRAEDRGQRPAHHRHLPGFGSVAKYVAVSTREAALDVASMSKTSTKVFILEVMGRHAGWIAAAAGLAGEKAGRPAPHHPVPRNPVRARGIPREGEGLRRRATTTA